MKEVIDWVFVALTLVSAFGMVAFNMKIMGLNLIPAVAESVCCTNTIRLYPENLRAAVRILGALLFVGGCALFGYFEMYWTLLANILWAFIGLGCLGIFMLFGDAERI